MEWEVQNAGGNLASIWEGNTILVTGLPRFEARMLANRHNMAIRKLQVRIETEEKLKERA